MADNQVKGSGDDEILVGTAGRDLIYGYGGNDELYGGDGNDMLYAGDGGDKLYGGAGDDGLVGGGSGDYMSGGTGNDTYYVTNSNDFVFELANEGVDTVVSMLANYRIGTNVERLYLAEGAALDPSSGRSNGSGNDLANRIKGNSDGNSLHGHGGDDEVGGFGGNDYINGGAGNDLLDGGTGEDTVTFKDGALNGVTVNLNLTTRYTTGAGNDVIVNFENIEGTSFNDTLIGNSVANKIYGISGNDFIRGGGGDDFLRGGTDADTFRFEAAAANGVDRVDDFTSGVDKLQFAVADGYSATAGLTLGAAAVGAGAQFVYNAATSTLSYDADGAGGAAAIDIARITAVLITDFDFLL